MISWLNLTPNSYGWDSNPLPLQNSFKYFANQLSYEIRKQINKQLRRKYFDTRLETLRLWRKFESLRSPLPPPPDRLNVMAWSKQLMRLTYQVTAWQLVYTGHPSWFYLPYVNPRTSPWLSVEQPAVQTSVVPLFSTFHSNHLFSFAMLAGYWRSFWRACAFALHRWNPHRHWVHYLMKV